MIIVFTDVNQGIATYKAILRHYQKSDREFMSDEYKYLKNCEAVSISLAVIKGSYMSKYCVGSATYGLLSASHGEQVKVYHNKVRKYKMTHMKFESRKRKLSI